MDSSPNYLDPRTLSELKDLTLRASTIVDGLVTGMHRSPYQGHSVEFAQHREYVAGDNIRHVDWKVFARTDKLHLKQFEDETNLCCWFLIDQSESMRFAAPGSAWTKFEFASCLAVAFAWLVLNQRDAVGLALFGQQLDKIGRPSDQTESLRNFIQVLESTDLSEQTSFRDCLNAFATETTKRGIVVVISDCFDDFDSIVTGLQSLRRRDHHVILLQVVDPAELTLEFSHSLELTTLESGQTLIVDPIKLKSAYQKVVAEQTSKLQGFCHRNSILYEQTTTDTNLAAVLNRVLKQQSTRSGRQG